LLAEIPPELGIPTAQIDAALDQVVADPAARARIAGAFIAPDGDLRLTAASEAFRDELVRQQPALGPVLETWVPPLSLPDLSTATSARSAADLWVWRLAVLAGVAFALSFLLGDRRRTARRFGYWSVGTGVLWLVGPLVAAWLAPRVTGRLDATATVVVREYTRPVVPWALALTIAGLVAISASFLVPSPSGADRSERADEPRSRQARATARPASGATSASTAPATQQVPVATGGVAPTRELPVQQGGAGAATAPSTRVRRDPADEPTRVMQRQPADQPTGDDRSDSGDVDVWAAYESSAPGSQQHD
jgi:hypothetical protein